jgi:hypothetical protein
MVGTVGEIGVASGQEARPQPEAGVAATFDRMGHCSIGIHATAIADAAKVAYWLDGEHNESALNYHERDLLEAFDRLAPFIQGLRLKVWGPAQ